MFERNCTAFERTGFLGLLDFRTLVFLWTLVLLCRNWILCYPLTLQICGTKGGDHNCFDKRSKTSDERIAGADAKGKSSRKGAKGQRRGGINGTQSMV